MNYFAHSIMYTVDHHRTTLLVHYPILQYYALVARGIRVPRLVAMLVTTVQTVQMFLGVMVSIYVYRLKVFHQMP